MLIIVMAGNYLNKILPPKRGPENIHEVNVGKQCHYVTWKAVLQIKTRGAVTTTTRQFRGAIYYAETGKNLQYMKRKQCRKSRHHPAGNADSMTS